MNSFVVITYNWSLGRLMSWPIECAHEDIELYVQKEMPGEVILSSMPNNPEVCSRLKLYTLSAPDIL